MAVRSMRLVLPAVVLVLGGCGFQVNIGAPSDADVLAAVSLTADDAAQSALFQPYDGGDQVVGQTSLDLCDADFPSEALRVGRNQVGIGRVTAPEWVSSEAILYPGPAQAEQAMSELARAAATCPESPVTRGADDPGRTWSFAAAPDAGWPTEPGVQRQAYAFTVTEADGSTRQATAIYLQRDRMVLALYSSPPDAASAVVRNSPDAQRFAEVMTRRLLAVPGQSLQSGAAQPPQSSDGSGFDT